ncbi:MAG: serine hydrolase domain-containing protein [Armatimonadota bacterium]
MAEYDVPGLSIAVVDHDETVWSEGFGVTEQNKSQRVTPKTVFSIQSISKTYTALGFLIAVDRGHISLDEPVKKYLPRFRVRSRDDVDYSSHITFRHLLSCRSGLPPEAPVGNNYSHSNFEDHIESILNLWLRHPPGERYSYSNLGFDLVAYVLQLVNRQPFEEYIARNIFAPIGMEVSTFDQNRFLINVESAVGHDKAPLVKTPVPMLGSAGMYSNADDMARFVSFLMTRGQSDGNNIVRPETLRLMYTPVAESESEFTYCLGAESGSFEGSRLMTHGGGGYGFRTTQDVLIDDGLGVVVLTNSRNHPFMQQTLSRRILKDMLDLERRILSEKEPSVDSAYNDYVGLYGARYNLGMVKYSVTMRNGKLFIGSDTLTEHSRKLFFTDGGDSVEFVDDGMVYYNVFFARIAVKEHNNTCEMKVSAVDSY